MVDESEHDVAGPRGVSFFPPTCRVALLEMFYFALIVLEAANLAFAIDVISQKFEICMVSLTESSLAILRKALQGRVNPWRFRSKHSFSFQGEGMVESGANYRFQSCYFRFKGVDSADHSSNINILKIVDVRIA